MSDLAGPVLVVGAGLIGTSVALALVRRGIAVSVDDIDPLNAAGAAARISGAGGEAPHGQPRLVVVATPPDQLATAIGAALRHGDAVVTDVGSVKVKPLTDLEAAAGGADAAAEALSDVDLARYVGGHPMAGSERSGPFAAAADLFDGRTWAITPHRVSSPHAVTVVESLVAACGALAVRLSPAEHDLAVARTSHLPHLMAALTAGLLGDAPTTHLALSGQGVRDVTRIAAGDPRLWRQIVTANAPALQGLLSDVRRDIDTLLTALDAGDSGSIETLLAMGVAGAHAIPGKHGGPPVDVAAVTVAIPDRPGALAQLFAEVGLLGVNIEDVRIDHDPARDYGLVEVDVAADAGERLVVALRERGWSAHR